jgi:thymidylate synthase (FAD)
MLIIDQSHEILAMHIDPALIELAGRTCYKSESKGDPEGFVSMVMGRHHDSVLEHSLLTVRFVTNRGVSHEIVRHRLASFSQESTRYVNYEKKGVVLIRPTWLCPSICGEHWVEELEDGRIHCATFVKMTDAVKRDKGFLLWQDAMMMAEVTYLQLLKQGWRPEQARGVLPNDLKTEIVVSANAREWRHIFKLRTAKAAHPDMRALMIPLLRELQGSSAAVLFNDIEVKE